MAKAEHLRVVDDAEDAPAPAGHNGALLFDDHDVRFLSSQYDTALAQEEELNGKLKVVRAAKSSIIRKAADKGLPAHLFLRAREMAALEDQPKARQEPLLLMRASQALGVDYKSVRADIAEAFGDPYATAKGKPNPAEIELKWENQGKRDMITGRGVAKGFVPDDIKTDSVLSQAYLRGQDIGIKLNEESFLRKNQVTNDPDTDKEQDEDGEAPAEEALAVEDGEADAEGDELEDDAPEPDLETGDDDAPEGDGDDD